MNVPEIRAALATGGRVYGTLVVSPSPHWPVHLAGAGLDGVMVGPHDLSCSLGAPEDYTSPAFTAALREILDSARRHGLIAGVHFMNCGPVELAIQWLRWGCNLIVQHADVVYAARGLAGELRAMREAFGQAGAGETQSFNV